MRRRADKQTRGRMFRKTLVGLTSADINVSHISAIDHLGNIWTAFRLLVSSGEHLGINTVVAGATTGNNLKLDGPDVRWLANNAEVSSGEAC